MQTILSWGLLAFAALALGVLVAVVTVYPVMLLWNGLMPGLFGLMTITFEQALMLSLLCSILFKSSSLSSSK